MSKVLIWTIGMILAIVPLSANAQKKTGNLNDKSSLAYIDQPTNSENPITSTATLELKKSKDTSDTTIKTTDNKSTTDKKVSSTTDPTNSTNPPNSLATRNPNETIISTESKIVYRASDSVKMIETTEVVKIGSKTITRTSRKPVIAVTPKTKAESAMLLPKTTEYVGNDKYKPVPLAGELNYYGHMNDYVLEYTKKYMGSFNRRLGSLTSPQKIACMKSIDQVFEKNNIPKELKYLAVIESALNKNAKSPVGAYGYWQFMEPTAKLMGLTVNSKRDDRSDIIKSTQAAAKYLNYLYDRLDDWLLVIAAYNSGPTPVIRAMKNTGKDDFWSIKKYLPKETQNHVLAFIATATIMERLDHFIQPGIPEDFKWSSLNVKRQIDTKDTAVVKKKNVLKEKFGEEEIKLMSIIRINNIIDLDVISQNLSIDRTLLGRWNYDYFSFMSEFEVGKSTYNLRIPKDKVEQFLEQKAKLEKLSRYVQ